MSATLYHLGGVDAASFCSAAQAEASKLGITGYAEASGDGVEVLVVNDDDFIVAQFDDWLSKQSGDIKASAPNDDQKARAGSDFSI